MTHSAFARTLLMTACSLPDLSPFRCHLLLSAVHRLDKLTSGLLLLAKNTGVASKLSQLIKEHSVCKTYVA